MSDLLNLKKEYKKDKKAIFGNKADFIHLAICIILLIVTPTILNFISSKNLEKIRNQNPAVVANQKTQNYKGEVKQILKEEKALDAIARGNFINQELEIEILEGTDKGKKIETIRQINSTSPEQKFSLKEKVVVQKNITEDGQINYFVIDKYRLDGLFWIIGVFFVLVVILAGLKGVTAFFGLAFSLLVLVEYLIPQILTGRNLLWTTFSTSLVIAFVAIYLSHGFNKRTSVAVAGTVISITISTLIATWAVSITKLTGLISEEATYLQTTQGVDALNFRGLLLCGLIIGSIGLIDDITTAQTTTVEELSLANPLYKFKDLFFIGLRVGREHVVSMVNTLAFAYVGSFLPLLLLLSIYNYSSLWVILNGEILAEEIVRTVVGSIALLLSVPITTFLAAYFLKSDPNQPKQPFD
jgi:uncharacterized membrane protein